MDISKNITYYRSQKGVTQQWLADAIDVSKMSISHFENGKRRPDIATIKKICKALDVTLGKFMAYNEGVTVFNGSFHKDFLALEDDIYMESSMLEDEVLNPPTYADELRTCGLKTTDMTDEEFVLAVETRELHHKLSFYDCVAYAVAKTRGWSLVTGDNRLRKLAEKNGVEVHGIIWVIQKCGFDDDRMKSIFDTIHSDSTILVPEDLLQAAFPVFDDK